MGVPVGILWGAGVVVLDHVDEGNSPHFVGAFESPKDGSSHDCDYRVIRIVYVYFLLVKDCDVVGLCKLVGAQQRVCGDAGRDVELFSRVPHFDWVLCDFSCSQDLASRE